MKIIKFLDEKFEEIILVAMLAVMVILIFLQVVMRYVFQDSLSWSEEVSRYFFLWIIWLGAAFATKKNAHISLDFVTRRLPKNGRIIAEILKNVLWLAFAIFLAYISWKLTILIFMRDQLSAALRIPMGFAYASIPVGITLMVARLLQNFYKKIKGTEDEVVD